MFLFLKGEVMWKNVGQFTEATDRGTQTRTHARQRMSSDDSLTQIPKQLCGYSLQDTELCTHTHTQSADDADAADAALCW